MAVPPGARQQGDGLVKNRRLALIWDVDESDCKGHHNKFLYPAIVKACSKRSKTALLKYSDGDTQTHDLGEFTEGTHVFLPTDTTCGGGCRDDVDLSSRFSHLRPSPVVCCKCTTVFHFDCVRKLNGLAPNVHVTRPANVDCATKWVCAMCVASAGEASTAPAVIVVDPGNPAVMQVCDASEQFAADVCAYVPGAVTYATHGDLRELRVPSERLSLLNNLRKRYLEGRQPIIREAVPFERESSPGVCRDLRCSVDCCDEDRSPIEIADTPVAPILVSSPPPEPMEVVVIDLSPAGETGNSPGTGNDSRASSHDELLSDAAMSPSIAPALLQSEAPSLMHLDIVPSLGCSGAPVDNSVPVTEQPGCRTAKPMRMRLALHADSPSLGPSTHASRADLTQLELRSPDECGKSGPYPAASDGDEVRRSFRKLQKTVSPLKVHEEDDELVRGGRAPRLRRSQDGPRLEPKRPWNDVNGATAVVSKKRPRINSEAVSCTKVAFDLECCIFCKRAGSALECEGDLIEGLSFDRRKPGGGKTIYKFSAHRNCLLWSAGPREEEKIYKGVLRRQWSNFQETVIRSQKVGKGKKHKWSDTAGLCHLCHEGGASLLCMYGGTLCSKPMHFRCALLRGAGLFIDAEGDRVTFCPAHQLGPVEKEDAPFLREDMYIQTPCTFASSVGGPEASIRSCACCEKNVFEYELGSVLSCGSCSRRFHARCVLPGVSSRVAGVFGVFAADGKFRCSSCPSLCEICDEQIESEPSGLLVVGDKPALSNGSDVDEKPAVASVVDCDLKQSKQERKCGGCNLNAVHAACYAKEMGSSSALPSKNIGESEPFWCKCCRSCRHCGAVGVDLASWTGSLSACETCCSLHADGNYCPVCDRAYPEDESDMICCDRCEKWVHADCSNLSQNDFAAAGKDESFKFVCTRCRPARKSKKRQKSSPVSDVPVPVAVEGYVEECVEASGALLSGDIGRTDTKSEVADDAVQEEEAEETAVDYALEANRDVELVWWPRSGANEGRGVKDLNPFVDLCRRCGSAGDEEELRFCADCGDAYHGFCCSVALPPRRLRPDDVDLPLSAGTCRRLYAGGLGVDCPVWRCDRCAMCKICGLEGKSQPYTCRHCGVGIHQECVPKELCHGNVDEEQRTLVCHECQSCDMCKIQGVSLVTVKEMHFCEQCAQMANCTVTSKASTSPSVKGVFAPDFVGFGLKLPGIDWPVSQSVSTDGSVVERGGTDTLGRAVERPKVGRIAPHPCEKSSGVLAGAIRDSELGETAGGVLGSTCENGVVQRRNRHREDERVCVLCKKGEEECVLLGRLLPWSSEVVEFRKLPLWWVHSLCAIWTFGVKFSFPNPEFLPIDSEQVERKFPPFAWNTCFLLADRAAVNSLRAGTCSHCGEVGGTIKCCKQDCEVRYHYACALAANCRMQVRTDGNYGGSEVSIDLRSVKALTVHCMTHACEGSDSSTVADDSEGGSVTLSSSRQLDLRIPLRLRSFWSQKEVRDGRQRVRVGGMAIASLGRLVPNCELFVQDDVLVPTDYRVVRRYWSVKHPGRRCSYFMDTSGSSRSGPIFTIHVSDDPNFRIRAPTSSQAWGKLSSALEWSRSALPGFSDLSLVATSGSDAFGLTNCAASVASIESLPMAALFKGRYMFSCVKPDALKDLPFSVPETLAGKAVLDPNECARSQGFVSRADRHTAARSYVNDPSGHRYQTHVAMGLDNEPVATGLEYSCNQSEHLDTLWKVSQSQKSRCVDSKGRNGEKPRAGDSVDDAPRNASTALYISQSFAMQHRAMDKSWRRRTVVLRSRIEGWGVFAAEDIRAKEMIIEYMGEVIRPITSDKREAYYDSKGIGCYMFEVEPGRIVDATLRGNRARYINHSCDPNCYSRTVKVENDRRAICIFASRDIKRGEELCYNYKFPLDEEDRVECACGTKACTGFMN